MDNTQIPQDVMALFKTTEYDVIEYLGDYLTEKVYNLGLKRNKYIPLVLIVKRDKQVRLVEDKNATKYVRYFNVQKFQSNLDSLICHQS